jgi:dienelactone hydrolase
MQVDLIQTTTRDGVRLDGMFQEASSTERKVSVDAFCLVHGTGGNFYSSTLFDALGERLLSMGCGVLRVNTRGHDGVSTAVTRQGGRRLGAAYEIVDDCRHDLAAWVDWLALRAGPRIGLIGHSLGAVKCLYALAHDPGLPVACVVAISPPRLSYSWFCSSDRRAEFLETYSLAERHVQAGQPAALLDVKLPLPFVITAAGYVEKYGPDERYDYLRLLGSVAVPALVTLGAIEVENNMAFRGTPDEVTEIGRRKGHIECQLVPQADHFYTGVRGDLCARVESWLLERRAIFP